jgi:ribosomal protein S18 acetylase RimI-like enzyme
MNIQGWVNKNCKFAQVEYVFIGEDDYEMSDAMYSLAKSVGINILRDKDPYLAVLDQGQVIGAAFISFNPDFSFDIAVAQPYQGQGIGSKLLDMCLNEGKGLEGIDLKLDVVNKNMIEPLLRRGLIIVKEIPGHTMMAYPSKAEPEEEFTPIT